MIVSHLISSKFGIILSSLSIVYNSNTVRNDYEDEYLNSTFDKAIKRQQSLAYKKLTNENGYATEAPSPAKGRSNLSKSIEISDRNSSVQKRNKSVLRSYKPKYNIRYYHF